MSDLLNWDEPAHEEPAPEREKLKPGDYKFKVVDWRRGEHGEGDTKKDFVDVFLEIKNKQVRDRLWLTQAAKWRMFQFFTCLGIRKHGEDIAPSKGFGDCTGLDGVCRIELNDRGYEEVKEYYESDGMPF
jgi:hypothetical protein